MATKRTLVLVVLWFLVASTDAVAQTVNVHWFNVNYLTIYYPGRLNLNSMDSYGIVGSTPYSTIETYVRTGYADGAWDGPGGIDSSVAAADSSGATALALVSGDDYLNYIYSGEESPTFFGNPVQSANSLIRYTYYGDSNLDGVVNAIDYAYLQFAMENGGPTAGYSGWMWGDFNYDGLIDDSDLALFNRNYSSNPPSLASVASPNAIAWKGGPSSDWALAANWYPNISVPDGAGVEVGFGEEGSNNLVDLKSREKTVGTMIFADTTSTTITSSGGYHLILDNNGQLSTIAVAGSHTITALVQFENDLLIFGPGTLDLAGGISGDHALTVRGNLTATSIQADALIIGAAGTPQAVPEPSALALLIATALGGLLVWRRR
jgi:hypothetical protein